MREVQNQSSSNSRNTGADERGVRSEANNRHKTHKKKKKKSQPRGSGEVNDFKVDIPKLV